MAFPRVHSGARAILKIADNIIVFATSVTWNIVTEFKEISTIDNSLPEELVPTNINVEVTCTSFRVPKESASVLALQPTILNHLHQKYLSIEIRDRKTNDVMLFIPKAMLTSRTGNVSSRQLSSETWTLKGIGYWDERPPQGPSPSKGDIISGIATLAKKVRSPVG